jgi:hypothetical protein
MRTTVDLPDVLLEQARTELANSQRSLRDFVSEGLQLALQRHQRPAEYRLVEAAFVGRVGFQPGFAAADLTFSIHADLDARGG